MVWLSWLGFAFAAPQAQPRPGRRHGRSGEVRFSFLPKIGKRSANTKWIERYYVKPKIGCTTEYMETTKLGYRSARSARHCLCHCDRDTAVTGDAPVSRARGRASLPPSIAVACCCTAETRRGLNGLRQRVTSTVNKCRAVYDAVYRVTIRSSTGQTHRILWCMDGSLRNSGAVWMMAMGSAPSPSSLRADASACERADPCNDDAFAFGFRASNGGVTEAFRPRGSTGLRSSKRDIP